MHAGKTLTHIKLKIERRGWGLGLLACAVIPVLEVETKKMILEAHWSSRSKRDPVSNSDKKNQGRWGPKNHTLG